MNDQELKELQIKPGIFRDQTQLDAAPFWYDCDKVRFRLGKPESFGGWQRISPPPSSYYDFGVIRAIQTWTTLMGKKWIGVGSHVGLFLNDGGSYFDITPIVATSVLANNLTTSVGSTLVRVDLAGHGTTPDSLIAFVSSSVTIGGNIVLNINPAASTTYQVVSTETDWFTFDAITTAAATSVSAGGTFQLIRYLPAGFREVIVGFGWGAGTWGAGTWGTPRGSGTNSDIRLWTLDNWGTDLLANPHGGHLYLYAGQDDPTIRATVVTAAPSIIDTICVSPEDRHVIAYGTHDLSGVYDPLLIRWASQESLSDWTPTATNTAGDKRLSGDATHVVRAIRANREIVIHTDSGLHIQRFLGPPDTFGIVQAGKECGLIGQNATTELDGRVFWMSNSKQFFSYSGRIEVLPCPVRRYVFDNINYFHTDKIYAGTNRTFNEIIWLYQSTASTSDVDRYVIFNFEEGTWYIGSFVRSAWKAADVFQYPIAACPTQQCLFYHEIPNGNADGSPLNTYLESSYGTWEAGDQIAHIGKTVPDFTAPDGTVAGQPINLYLKGRKYPNGPITTKGPYLINNTTTKLSTRMRAREFAVRIEHDQTNKQWRMGKLRAAIAPDGQQ